MKIITGVFVTTAECKQEIEMHDFPKIINKGISNKLREQRREYEKHKPL